MSSSASSDVTAKAKKSRRVQSVLLGRPDRRDRHAEDGGDGIDEVFFAWGHLAIGGYAGHAGGNYLSLQLWGSFGQGLQGGVEVAQRAVRLRKR